MLVEVLTFMFAHTRHEMKEETVEVFRLREEVAEAMRREALKVPWWWLSCRSHWASRWLVGKRLEKVSTRLLLGQCPVWFVQPCRGPDGIVCFMLLLRSLAMTTPSSRGIAHNDLIAK